MKVFTKILTSQYKQRKEAGFTSFQVQLISDNDVMKFDQDETILKMASLGELHSVTMPESYSSKYSFIEDLIYSKSIEAFGIVIDKISALNETYKTNTGLVMHTAFHYDFNTKVEDYLDVVDVLSDKLKKSSVKLHILNVIPRKEQELDFVLEFPNVYEVAVELIKDLRERGSESIFNAIDIPTLLYHDNVKEVMQVYNRVPKTSSPVGKYLGLASSIASYINLGSFKGETFYGRSKQFESIQDEQFIEIIDRLKLLKSDLPICLDIKAWGKAGEQMLCDVRDIIESI